MKLYMLGFSAILVAGPQVAVPDDLASAFQQLKEAETKKDTAMLKRLAGETSAMARKVISTPAPENAAEKEAWASRIEHARSIDVYTEYALYSAAVQAPPETTVDLLSTLEGQNPKSKYLDEAYPHYFAALNKTGAASKIPAIAEKAITQLPENEDLLLVVAESAMNKKQNDRALGYAERLINVLNKHSKPEGVAAADWERKRTAALGRAYWIAGIMHGEKAQYYEADRDLRAALPIIRGNDAMAAAALFHLGIANYQLGKTFLKKALVLEAVKFSEQAAAIKSPFAEQAWRNAAAMRTEAAKMR